MRLHKTQESIRRDRLTTTEDAAHEMLSAANRVLDAWAGLLAERHERKWQPSPEEPALVIGGGHGRERGRDGAGVPEHHADGEHVQRLGLDRGTTWAYLPGSTGTTTGAQLTYNNEGELQSWQNAPSSPSTQYLYDGQGQRVEQVVTQCGTTTSTAYVGDVEEVSTTSTTTTTAYYYASGQRIGLSVNGGTPSYLATDALGSAITKLHGSSWQHTVCRSEGTGRQHGVSPGPAGDLQPMGAGDGPPDRGTGCLAANRIRSASGMR